MNFKALRDLTVGMFVDKYCDGGVVYIHGAMEKYFLKGHNYTVITLCDGHYNQLQETGGGVTHWLGNNPKKQLQQLEKDGIICLERS